MTSWTIKYGALGLLALVIFICGLGLGLFFADRECPADGTPIPPGHSATSSSTTHTGTVTIVSPDGTTTTTTDSTTTSTKFKPSAKYRLGVNYERSFNPHGRPDSFELTGAIRLADTPAHLQMGINPLLKQVTLGLSWEF